MNAYGAIALVIGWLSVMHTKATATVGTAHLTIPLLWLLAAAVVLALAAMVLIVWRAIMRDGGLWLTVKPAVATGGA
jgi:hypothetical protein